MYGCYIGVGVYVYVHMHVCMCVWLVVCLLREDGETFVIVKILCEKTVKLKWVKL